MAGDKIKAPRVFISYSQDSTEHKDRVLALSNHLIHDGLHCYIDRYVLSPPEGWQRWMEKQIEEADFVLVICTARYFRRVQGEEKPDVGNAVRWESVIIYQSLYDTGTLILNSFRFYSKEPVFQIYLLQLKVLHIIILQLKQVMKTSIGI